MTSVTSKLHSCSVPSAQSLAFTFLKLPQAPMAIVSGSQQDSLSVLTPAAALSGWKCHSHWASLGMQRKSRCVARVPQIPQALFARLSPSFACNRMTPDLHNVVGLWKGKAWGPSTKMHSLSIATKTLAQSIPKRITQRIKQVTVLQVDCRFHHVFSAIGPFGEEQIKPSSW